jgi:FOG: TPR repeat, SEL1 subfamily
MTMEYNKIKTLLLGALLLCSTASFAQTYLRDAQLGDKNAQYKLGRMYEKSDRMPKDITKAIYWYEQAAKQDQPQAIEALAELYYYGVDVQQKPHLAFALFTRSAKFKNSEAYYCLGEMYYAGLGTVQDKSTAFSWYKKAADEGNLAKAQYKIGKMLFEADGIKENKAMGINYIKLAFNNGFPMANEYWIEKQMWKYEQ